MSEDKKNKVSAQDKYYHEKSLILAKIFKTLYKQRGADNKLTAVVKEKYIEARRQIAKDESGVRYGHAEAYKILKGEDD